MSGRPYIIIDVTWSSETNTEKDHVKSWNDRQVLEYMKLLVEANNKYVPNRAV